MVSKLAEEFGPPLPVDSTLTATYLFRPLEHGAHVVAHPLLKWIDGIGVSWYNGKKRHGICPKSRIVLKNPLNGAL